MAQESAGTDGENGSGDEKLHGEKNMELDGPVNRRPHDTADSPLGGTAGAVPPVKVERTHRNGGTHFFCVAPAAKKMRHGMRSARTPCGAPPYPP